MPPDPRTAFIHIGMPKTGTTAIQAACDAGRDVLARQGYHYLSGDRNHGEWLSLVFWEEADALRLAGYRWRDGADARAYRAARRAALEQEIGETAQDLILSAEELSMFRRNEVAALRDTLALQFDRFRIVAYLREPLGWATSAAQQATKWSGDRIDDLFDRPRLPEFEARFTPWLDIFDGDVTFRAFGDRDIVEDFSEAIGLAEPLETHERLNEAVSHRSVVLLSHANVVAAPFVDARHNPFRSFDFTRDARLPGRRFSLPRDTVEAWHGALADERDWANAALGRAAFHDPGLPENSREAWMGGEREALERFAETFLETSRRAQNERAMRMLLLARTHRENGRRARDLLDQAWLLTTDRWTMDQIAQEALKQDRSDREKFFAKGRLMRRIEAPEAGDAPLVIGNPFDRPWRKPSNDKACAA